MRLFAETASTGSLSAAGRKLGLSPAAASARLKKLETALRAKLLDRTTRHLRLTEEGRLYLAHCEVALQSIHEVEALLREGQGMVQGKVRISASTDFGRQVLDRWLDMFASLHPGVRVALTLTDSVSNLHQDNVDLAIRFGSPRAAPWSHGGWHPIAGCSAPRLTTWSATARHAHPRRSRAIASSCW